MTHSAVSRRPAAVRRGQWLTWATIAYNSLEGLLSVGAGLFAGSIALVGFGLDSFIEVTASGAAVWRLHRDADVTHRERAERSALRVIGSSFLALAAYITIDALHSLLTRNEPRGSALGIVIALASLVVMPILARAKRAVARQLDSGALRAEARQTDFCMYLSGLLLIGLASNALFGWWWADPICALLMVPLVVWEGRETLRGRAVCDDCAPPE
jgi:divalent metal cation (Fe/Co/Zn/Cd) transporter